MIRKPREVAAFQLRNRLRAAAATGQAGKQEAVLASITASYFYLRRGLAALGFAFPLLLWLGTDPHHLQTSISAYYHYSPSRAGYGAGAMRDVFVGILWAVGAGLFLYKGYSAREDWALNLAGAAAAGIACFPMDWPEGAGGTVTGTVHYTSAALFFLAIAFVCLFCADETLAALADARQRRRFKRAYRLIGMLMVAVPLAVLAIHLALDRPQHSYVTLGVEVAGIWIFACFWLAKSREIALIEGQKAEPVAPAPAARPDGSSKRASRRPPAGRDQDRSRSNALPGGAR